MLKMVIVSLLILSSCAPTCIRGVKLQRSNGATAQVAEVCYYGTMPNIGLWFVTAREVDDCFCEEDENAEETTQKIK